MLEVPYLSDLQTGARQNQLALILYDTTPRMSVSKLAWVHAEIPAA